MYNTIDLSVAYQGKNVFGVLEKDTDQVVAISLDRTIARTVMNSLNGGCGFRGFTPAFFMNNRPQIIPKESSL